MKLEKLASKVANRFLEQNLWKLSVLEIWASSLSEDHNYDQWQIYFYGCVSKSSAYHRVVNNYPPSITYPLQFQEILLMWITYPPRFLDFQNSCVNNLPPRRIKIPAREARRDFFGGFRVYTRGNCAAGENFWNHFWCE